jgi:ribose transport system substrate-binding protein
MTLSRRDVLKRAGVVGAGAAASLSMAGGALAGPGGASKSTPLRAQAAGKKVIFVTHDDNPFFVPVRFGFEEFGKQVGWQTQWVGPPHQDEVATVQYQLDAIAAKPVAVGFTRTNTSQFDDNIKKAQEAGIFVILYNTASDGYQDLGVAYVGQEFIPAGIKSGLQAAKYAAELSGKKEGVIVLGSIAPGHSALDQRQEGARQGIAQYNKENGTNFTTEDLKTDTDQATAIAAIDAKATELGDKLVGFAHADYVHWFTGLWIEQKGIKGKIANGGFDLVQGAMDAIKNGTAQWSIGQNPYAQGWVTSSLIYMATEHNYPPFSYDTGAEIVDASNIDAVMAREAVFNK